MFVLFPLMMAVSLLLAWACMVAYTMWMLTHPPRRGFAYALSRGAPADPAAALGLTVGSDGQLPWREWTVSTSKNALLKVWDVPGRNPAGPVVIVSHGWGDSRVVMLPRLQTLATHASRIILWDMSGHGESGGTCSLGNLEVDQLLSVIDAARADRVVLYGFSLGAGVSIAAAARLGDRASAVIAEAPYRWAITPARNVLHIRGLPHTFTLAPALMLLGVRLGLGPNWATRGVFDRAALAAKLSSATSLFILHGEHDAICPLDDAREIAAAGRGTCTTIPSGTHAELWTSPRTRDATAQAVRHIFLSLVDRTLPTSSPNQQAAPHA